MAEIFGVVAGVLSVATLFNNCVDCFEYVQLGRRFGRDFGRCQLKLDVAKIRLSRWGQAVAINQDPRFATDAPVDKVSQQVRDVLEEVALLFLAVQKSSKRYENNVEQDDLVPFQDEDMPPVVRRLHERLDAIARQRQKQTSMLKKVRWALHDGKNFERLVEQITGFVDDLEKLMPVEAARHRLMELEIEEVDDEPTLIALQEATASTDEQLSGAVAQKIEILTGRNTAKDIKTENKARFQVGNGWSETALSHATGFTDTTVNTAESVCAIDTSAIQIGNTYGGRLIFDD